MTTTTTDRPPVQPSPSPGRGRALAPMLEAALVNKFDTDVYHVMNQADDALVSDEILNGAKSGVFAYSFEILSTPVQGISVIGAAHLASHYGGIKHRIIATIEKRGNVLIATSYPGPGIPMRMEAMPASGFEDEDDFFKTVIEVENIKNGNTVQMEATEKRIGKSRSGTFERPHFDKIAQSKAYRNGVLRVIPQDVQRLFLNDCLKQGKSKDITRDVIEEKRRNVVTFATKHGIPVQREAVFQLGMDQIEGLGQAAASGEGAKAAFVQACIGLGLLREDGTGGGAQQITDKTKPEPKKAATPKVEPKKEVTKPPADDGRPTPPDDPDFG